MIIRKLTENDLEARVSWVNNPRVYKSMHFGVPITIEGTRNWFLKITKDNTRRDLTFEFDGELCAMGGFTDMADDAELYIFVSPYFQGKGLGKIATSLLCEYGFYNLNLESIYLFTNSDNIAAQKTYETLGFRLISIENESSLNGDGKVVDRFKYILNPNLFTPVDKPFLQIDDCDYGGVSFKVVRDDIFPFIGGGSKARKAVEYERFLKEHGYNAIVTCGGVQSNHNRAMALMAARNGWKCHLCVQDKDHRFYNEKGNALLDRIAGADIEIIKPDETAEAMDCAMQRLKEEGYKPYYVHGGGHDLPGGTSFVKAIEELKRQCDKNNYKPDHIFHASGTGSTQAGLVVGLNRVGWADVKVVGISVARKYDRGKQVISNFSNMLARHYNICKNFTEDIIFCTDYLCGGYEQFTPKMVKFLAQAMSQTGLVFDTTYSGKAFFGMMDYVHKHKLEQDNILFWHTGGIMNVMK